MFISTVTLILTPSCPQSRPHSHPHDHTHTQGHTHTHTLTPTLTSTPNAHTHTLTTIPTPRVKPSHPHSHPHARTRSARKCKGEWSLIDPRGGFEPCCVDPGLNSPVSLTLAFSRWIFSYCVRMFACWRVWFSFSVSLFYLSFLLVNWEVNKSIFFILPYLFVFIFCFITLFISSCLVVCLFFLLH